MADLAIRLSRSVRTRTVDFYGEVGTRRTRGDHISILMCVVEHGGALSAKELSDHLLGGGREAIAMRLLHQLEASGDVRRLEGEEWTLTPDGIHSLQVGSTLQRVRSVWRLTFTEDDVFGGAIVRLELAPGGGVFEGLKSARSGASLTPPDWMADLCGQPWEALDMTSGDMRILTVESAGPPTPPKATLVHRVDGVSGVHQLVEDGQEGVLLSWEEQPVALPEVFAQGWAAWDAEHGWLATPSRSLGDDEVLTGRASLRSPSPVELGGLGTFTQVEGVGVPVGPVDEDDAEDWLRRRVVTLLSGPAFKDEWEALVERARTGLGRGGAEPLGRADVAALLDRGERPEAWWALTAPEDWGV